MSYYRQGVLRYTGLAIIKKAFAIDLSNAIKMILMSEYQVNKMANDKKALVVGINKYKNYSQSNLNGCVNDTKNMVAFLKNFRGFTDSEITVLTDEKATKANIMKGLNDMVKGKYKYIAFTMSSHGTQVPDIENDESDRLDEAFCPHDLQELNGNWHPDHVIKDDELHDLFVQLPSTTTVEVWLDTCHSGSGLKVIDLAPGKGNKVHSAALDECVHEGRRPGKVK